jgi:hypothetical protein
MSFHHNGKQVAQEGLLEEVILGTGRLRRHQLRGRLAQSKGAACAKALRRMRV